MFKKMKVSLLALLLVVSMVALVACGDKKESTSPTTSPITTTENKAAQQTPAEKVELTISAAASLTESLKEIQTLYEGKHSNIKLNYNFGASGTLQQQIEQGAPADVFISAGKKQMQALVDKQLVDTAKQKNLLTNALVLVVPFDGKVSVDTIEDLAKADIKNIAVGQPESVPAGSYAKDALTYYKLWDTLQSKIVLAKDVRQVLTYVETGNSDAGFVYKTDVMTSKKVKVALSVDQKSYKTIEYPIGLIKATKHNKEAQEFYDFLQSKESQDIFVKYGFSLPKS